MNPPERRVSIGPGNKCVVSALAIAAWCVAVQAAPIHEAAASGNLARVKTLLEQDPSQLNATNALGLSALTCALIAEKKPVADFLQAKGATEDIFGAAINGRTARLTALLKENPKRASLRESTGKTALHWAAFHGHQAAVELLLAQKADVNALDNEGFTPLHWAVMFNRHDTVKVLLRNKASTTVKVAKYGWTPLRLAVIHGHMATAEVLLKGGADANFKDEENIPLLHQAVILGKTDMVGLLLAHKCDINLVDPEGETPLSEALEQNNQGMATFLRQHGAKEIRVRGSK